jgi:hypothetical protein
LKKTAKVLGSILLWLLFLCLAAWGAMAIYYANLPAITRTFAAVLFALGAPAVLILVHPLRRALLIFFSVFALVLLWWLRIPSSNDRKWQTDVTTLPSATIDGNRVTVRNIRNCDYRSETDYTCRYYHKTFDLAKLKTADLFIIYWGSPYIAHTMFSFGFGEDGELCFSIETRKEVGEEYSAIKGFFRQYELTYIVADERDLVRLRTNYRKEDVYLYRLKANPELIRKVFLDYLREVNQIKGRPEWYNALTSNCTTNIRGHTAQFNPDAKFDWRIIVNGYLDRLLYERRVVDTSMPFEELKRKSYINKAAQAADRAPDFSRRIRDGLPGMAR